MSLVKKDIKVVILFNQVLLWNQAVANLNFSAFSAFHNLGHSVCQK